MKVLSRREYEDNGGMGMQLPLVRIAERPEADEVRLDVPPEELARLGKEGIPAKDGSRRGPLALDMLSMNVIKNYFTSLC